MNHKSGFVEVSVGEVRFIGFFLEKQNRMAIVAQW
jgi:hypothetical protein